MDTPGALQMKRILIVDDEDLIRYSLSAALRQDDTLVKPVSCGKEALGEIDTLFYDLCFLDVNLPDINGLDLMKTIKQTSPTTKIIIMTARAVAEPELVRSIQENAALFLSKPFDLDSVKLFVERILGQGTPLRQAGTGHETFENRLMDGKRQCERKTVMHESFCSVVAADCRPGEKSFLAGILETSETGMCLRTDSLLKPGQILRFSDNFVPSAGVVRWSKGGGAGDSFRAGIQFVPEGAPHRSGSQSQADGDG